jgi:hypothetical protein
MVTKKCVNENMYPCMCFSCYRPRSDVTTYIKLISLAIQDRVYIHNQGFLEVVELSFFDYSTIPSLFSA